jgi:hypothetical protein
MAHDALLKAVGASKDHRVGHTQQDGVVGFDLNWKNMMSLDKITWRKQPGSEALEAGSPKLTQKRIDREINVWTYNGKNAHALLNMRHARHFGEPIRTRLVRLRLHDSASSASERNGRHFHHVIYRRWHFGIESFEI